LKPYLTGPPASVANSRQSADAARSFTKVTQLRFGCGSVNDCYQLVWQTVRRLDKIFNFFQVTSGVRQGGFCLQLPNPLWIRAWVSIIFGTQNLLQVFSLWGSNWWILIKLDASLLYFHANHLQQATLLRKWVYAKRIVYYFFLICVSLKVLKLTNW